MKLKFIYKDHFQEILNEGIFKFNALWKVLSSVRIESQKLRIFDLGRD